ncbi:MAG: hypothetical protein COA44_15360 [Arcobacter sp.]|nr:MAG: hypothetical protein COA44_15360 [Arcobacter sp.]
MLNEKTRFYGRTKKIDIEVLKNVFNSDRFVYIDIVLLFGSRAVGSYHERSDYDFAVLADEGENRSWGTLSSIWNDIGSSLKLDEVDYDVVDLREATDEMKKSIKKGYVILKGENDDISRILG